MSAKLFLSIAIAILFAGPERVIAQHQLLPTLQHNIAQSNERESRQLFQLLPNQNKIDVKKDLKEAVFLKLNLNELAALKKNTPALLQLQLPISANNTLTFHLKETKILSDYFSVTTDKEKKINYTPGAYYQGNIDGISPSLAGFGLFDNSVMAVYSYNNDNYVLGVWKDKSNIDNTIYILYKDRDVLFKREFKCGTEDKPKSNSINTNGQIASNQCIKIYFECDYQMYLDFNSNVTDVTNYVTGFFNVVQLLYTNEQLNVEISQIYVWTTSDPYIPYTSSTDLLNNFQATRTSFNGNVAHLLSTRTINAGGLAYLDVICTPSNAYAISNIDNGYMAYPNFSWTVEVVTHELGHNFGSHHTHWCGWPGGPIDNCYPVDDGPCAAGPTPTNSGTIMSYCHLSSIGISFTNGFGPLPGGAIRTAYNAASCLTPCASPPQTNFTTSVTNFCAPPATVTFTDQTIGYITSWAWDVDNNGTIDYTTQSPTHTYTSNGSYTVKLITSNSNGNDTLIKTNYVIVGTVTPAVTIAITTGNNPTCEQLPITFTASPVNGGASPAYQWYKNGNAIVGATFPTYTSSLLANNDAITCHITSDAPCPSPTTATSSAITMTIDSNVTPDITVAITTGTSNICAGTPVTFTATPLHGGNTPLYQWKINGVSVGSNGPNLTYSSSTLLNGDLITCTLTSNANCASPTSITSNIVAVTVNPIVTPTVSIAVTSGSNPSCPNVPMTFTASSTNGGTVPVYQWKKNGVNVSIGTTYTPTAPADGDIITCVVTSNASCLTTPTATSSNTTISILSSQAPTASIAISSGSNPTCVGSSIGFTATAGNTFTPSYQWFLNGGPITGEQNQTFTATSLANGSIITCMISSMNVCNETAMSQAIHIEIAPVATLNFIADMDICGGAIGATNFSSNPIGANYVWTNSNTAIGLASSGNGDLPEFNATNTTTNPIVSTITVTPSINGCPGTPSSYTITINPTPTITQNGTVLTSDAANSYQWYRNGQLIAGATNQTYNAQIPGDYCVIVDGGGCPSNTIGVGTAGVDQLEANSYFNLYPNPNNGNFFVSFSTPEKGTYKLKMINAIGELVYIETLTDFQGVLSKQINIDGLAKGIYLFSLSNSANEVTRKVIVY